MAWHCESFNRKKHGQSNAKAPVDRLTKSCIGPSPRFHCRNGAIHLTHFLNVPCYWIHRSTVHKAHLLFRCISGRHQDAKLLAENIKMMKDRKDRKDRGCVWMSHVDCRVDSVKLAFRPCRCFTAVPRCYQCNAVVPSFCSKSGGFMETIW